jgi:hypothetical protein
MLLFLLSAEQKNSAKNIPSKTEIIFLFVCCYCIQVPTLYSKTLQGNVLL